MNKTPLKTAGGTDPFLIQMKEFYEVKEQRERGKSKNQKQSK